MKNYYLYFLLFCFGASTALQAQTMQKFVLVEHFTNTYCPICSNRNPALHEVINQYPDQVHRISIHPSTPYSQCPLYQYNTEDNGARQAYYNVRGTPTMYIDGVGSSSSASVFASDLESALTATSGIQILVEESQGQNRTVDVTIAAEIDYPAADYRIFVALVEANLMFQANNGENEHFNVLRDYLTAPEGDPITLPAAGQQMQLQYNVEIPGDVSVEEAYILVYIQNLETREVLNSGTRFDQTTVSTSNLSTAAEMRVFPNPATDMLQVETAKDYPITGFEILSLGGQKLQQSILTEKSVTTTISLGDLPQGQYILKVSLEEGTASKAFMKQ